MFGARLTTKGQVTIPAGIRLAMGVKPQDRISFTPMPGGTVVLRAKTKSLLSLKGMLIPAPDVSVSIAEMSLGSG